MRDVSVIGGYNDLKIISLGDSSQPAPNSVYDNTATYTGGGSYVGKDGGHYSVDNYSDGARFIQTSDSPSWTGSRWAAPGEVIPGLDVMPEHGINILPWVGIGIGSLVLYKLLS